ncbi:MAG: GGDEF domain-containing protein, partial [Sphaerochaeta sp.]|nr:GGDEF domain-containing protein [Sphaerochaeta sp.]
YNRRYFLERINLHLLQKGTAHIMLCDLDHFKHINDTYGHLAGDAVLKEFAQIARSVLKHTHAIARFGGDEFVIALTQKSDLEALEIAEHLRTAVDQHVFHYQSEELRVSISIGVAVLSKKDIDGSALIADADRALYQAKEAGRNLVKLMNKGEGGDV